MSVVDRQNSVEQVDARSKLSRRGIFKGAGALTATGMFAALPFTATRAYAQGAWDRETDIVVVGAGTAGTPAAIEAARAGAEVLRLEKVEVAGGNMSHSQGIIYLGGGTELQKKHGFEDTPDSMFAYLSAFMEPWEDPEFLRFYCENSVEHYDWLVGEGVQFGESYTDAKVVTAPEGGLSYCGNEVNYPFNEITPPVPRGHCVVGLGAAMSEALQASAEAEPNITTEVNAPVTNLVIDDSGRVIGVVAQIGGEEQQILARRGVILASGGYEMNEEMLDRTIAKHYQMSPAGSAYRGNTGDGIRMAGSLGARLRNMDQTFSTMFVYPPDARVHSVLINGKGRRFVNEASYGIVIGDLVLHAEQFTAWVVMDSSIAETVAAAGRDISEPDATGESLEELAAVIGVPAEVLVNEINFYNEHAAAGVDPIYHKPSEFLTPIENGPFLAFSLTKTNSFLTSGSVEINTSAQVLDQYGQVVPGLYAAGQNGAGIGRRYYNSGIRLGEGSFFGRVAGKSAAAAEMWEGTTAIVVASGLTGQATSAAPADTGATSEAADVEVTLEAVDIAYSENEMRIPADTNVAIVMTNNGAIPHDVAIEETDYVSEMADGGETVRLIVNLPAGEYIFYCTVPGHRSGGMEGTLIVE